MTEGRSATAPAQRLLWREATLVSRHPEAADAVTLALDVPGWPGHLAGQHVGVRLTAEDGYTAQRSYSLASPDRVEITVQQVADGEVSPYLVADMQPGDRCEVRGPIGGWFVWTPEQTEPILLVAGGSGLVPLMAMVRARGLAGSRAPFRLITSVRTPADRLYSGEPAQPGLDVSVLWTRQAPDGDRRALELDGVRRPPGRVTASDLVAHGWPAEFEPTVYVCGPTGFVEHVADLLVGLGHDPARIRTERFGPTS